MAPEKLKTLIGYVRVSTSQQGRSGLGLEAQKQALERFAEAEGFTLSRVFIEVETGKGSDALERRPVWTELVETYVLAANKVFAVFEPG